MYGSIVNVNSDKTEVTYFKQDEAIFSLNCRPLKLVDKFTILGWNKPSTESHVNIHIEKA